MGLLSKTNLLLLPVLCCFCLNLTVAIDTIRSSQFINDSEYLISSGSVFKLGFFSPENSTNRYLGIWYNNISVFTVIWVANREKPINDSSGVLTISEDGNLVVLNGQAEILWSSNVSNSVTNSSATLGDFGNLVLRADTTGLVLWESFQHPSDTILSRMKLSTSSKKDQRVQLTSWKSPSDPSIGSFSSGIEPPKIPEAFVWKEGRPYWRSGPWNGQVFIGMPNWNPGYYTGFTFIDDANGTVFETFTGLDMLHLSKIVLDWQGNVVHTYWDDGKEDWEIVHKNPEDECDVYGTCGAFGSCDLLSSPICSCLRGFEPKIIKEWNRGNWTSGCVRRTPLQCERMNNSIGEGKADGFLKLEMIKVPDFAELALDVNIEDCRKQCLENCSCVAYGYYTGIGCLSWSGNLIDLRHFSVGGSDIYIRSANLQFEEERNLRVIITITVTIGVIAIAKQTFVADGVFYAELNEVLTRELAEDGYSGVEVRVTPMRTVIIIRATCVLGEKGRRIRELTSVVQKRFKFPENSVELYAEKVNNRGLCAIAQAESLRYKLLGGLAVRRACYGVLRFVMESGAKGCEVIVSGKLRAQRAKAMKFKDGYMISSGQPVNEYIDSAVRHVLLRQGAFGVKVKIMLDWDPKGKVGPITPLPDLVTIQSPKEEEGYNFTPALAASNIEIAAV